MVTPCFVRVKVRLHYGCERKRTRKFGTSKSVNGRPNAKERLFSPFVRLRCRSNKCSGEIKENAIQYKRHSTSDDRFACVLVVSLNDWAESLPNLRPDSFASNRTIRSRSRL